MDNDSGNICSGLGLLGHHYTGSDYSHLIFFPILLASTFCYRQHGTQQLTAEVTSQQILPYGGRGFATIRPTRGFPDSKLSGDGILLMGVDWHNNSGWKWLQATENALKEYTNHCTYKYAILDTVYRLLCHTVISYLASHAVGYVVCECIFYWPFRFFHATYLAAFVAT